MFKHLWLTGGMFMYLCLRRLRVETSAVDSEEAS